jgi:leader peptidase (prepilin peptidase)/N-methyltransferase
MIEVFFFILGACIGSFLNVCIFRTARKESIILPASHCMSCGRPLAWYDNIPFISYILLRGRCRHCRERISLQYFVVELITALLFAAFYRYFGISAEFFIYTALACALIVVSFVDLRIQEIPDGITLPGMAVGLILSAVFPDIMSKEGRIAALTDSVLGIVAGGGLIYLMGLIGESIFKKEAMGGGDVKLMGMLGAFLGWRLVILAFFLAPLFGSIAGIALKINRGAETIPYGPHLALSGTVALIWGDRILRYLIPY